MTFIKVENIVLNTKYIAAVKLESETCSGEKCVSILMVTQKIPRIQLEANYQNLYDYEYLNFTGEKAEVLQNYFSISSKVMELLPQEKTAL